MPGFNESGCSGSYEEARKDRVCGELTSEEKKEMQHGKEGVDIHLFRTTSSGLNWVSSHALRLY
jgi:hypothetical protein